MSASPRRTVWVVALFSVATSAAWATEYGHVVSATPIVAAVPVPRQECTEQPVAYQQPNTGAGALIGGIAGAAIGNTVGGGSGRAAATGIGLLAGSLIGNQVEANANPPVATTVRSCRTVTHYENRTIGYDVVYEYQGMRRHAQLAQDPGERIALNVNVAPADAAAPPAAYDQAPPPVAYQAPYDASPYVASPYYVSPYYASPYYGYPVPAISLGFGWGWGGGHGHGHRH